MPILQEMETHWIKPFAPGHMASKEQNQDSNPGLSH